MSELAFNMNGEPFELPATATGWRVRRMKQKGAPEVVYGRDGLPLVVPIDAELEDLRHEVGGTTGRYRLDPVEGHRPIPNAPAAYVFVHEAELASAAPRNEVSLPPPSDNVVIEALRMNSEIAKSVVDRFPQMLEAAAVLLRAADGAGLPARPGMATDGQDDEEHEDSAAPDQRTGLDLGALFAQAAPLLIALASGKTKVPDFASLFDWKRAAQKGAAARRQTSEVAEPSESHEATATAEPTLEAELMSDPAAMQQLMMIMQALTPEEGALARALAGELSPVERRAWFHELKALEVPEAVQKVRTLLTQASNKAGAS